MTVEEACEFVCEQVFPNWKSLLPESDQQLKVYNLIISDVSLCMVQSHRNKYVSDKETLTEYVEYNKLHIARIMLTVYEDTAQMAKLAWQMKMNNLYDMLMTVIWNELDANEYN